MKTTKTVHPEPAWKKGETRSCPGTCGHPHVAKTGPCTKTGCGCQGKVKR